MKNLFNPKRFATFCVAQKTGSKSALVRLLALLALSFAVAGIAPHLVSEAQRREGPSKVWSVAAQPSGDGTVVRITSDAPLGRAQTWQDSEGYHIVLPNTVLGDALRAVRGVKVRRVGSSAELLLQTKPGSKVSVQSEGNGLSLLVDKKLDARADGNLQFGTSVSEEQRLFADAPRNQQWQRDAAPLKFSTPVEDLSANGRSSTGETAQPGDNSNPQVGQASTTPEQLPKQTLVTTEPGPTQVAVPTAGKGRPAAVVSPETVETHVAVQVDDEGVLASIFSGKTSAIAVSSA